MRSKDQQGAPKRMRRAPEDARASILGAAIRVMARYGPDAVGIKDVAQECGVSPALVGHYFGTYEALVKSAVIESLTRMRTHLINELMGPGVYSPEIVLRRYFETMMLEPGYGRLLSWALLSRKDVPNEIARDIATDMMHVKMIVGGRTGKLNGTATDSEIESLIVSIWSAAIGYVAGRDFFWKAFGRAPEPALDDMFVKAMLELVAPLFAPRKEGE